MIHGAQGAVATGFLWRMGMCPRLWWGPIPRPDACGSTLHARAYNPPMHTRLSRAITSWIAVLAVLMSALAPSISHALAKGGSVSWVEVCTDRGSKWIDPSSGEEAPSPGATSDLCPYCVFHAEAAIVGPVSTQVPFVAQARYVPPAFLRAPRVAHAWRAPHSRAPPQFG